MKARLSSSTRRALAVAGAVTVGLCAAAPSAHATMAPSTEWITIGQVRGSGDSFPIVVTTGSPVYISARVTAVYPTGGFDGYYMQSVDSTVQAPGVASQAVWVPSGTAPTGIVPGDNWASGPLGIANVAGTVEAQQGPAVLPTMYAGHGTPPSAVDLAVLPADDAARLSYDGMLVHPTGTFTASDTSKLSTLGQVTLTDASGVAIILDDGSSWNLATDAAAAGSPKPYTQLTVASTVHFIAPVILARRAGIWMLEPTSQVTGQGTGVLTSTAPVKTAPVKGRKVTATTVKTAMVKASGTCTGFTVAVTGARSGNVLRIAGRWKGAARSVSVPATRASWSLAADASWQRATASVLRRGTTVALASTTLTKAETCSAVTSAHAR